MKYDVVICSTDYAIRPDELGGELPKEYWALEGIDSVFMVTGYTCWPRREWTAIWPTSA